MGNGPRPSDIWKRRGVVLEKEDNGVITEIRGDDDGKCKKGDDDSGNGGAQDDVDSDGTILGREHAAGKQHIRLICKANRLTSS